MAGGSVCARVLLWMLTPGVGTGMGGSCWFSGCVIVLVMDVYMPALDVYGCECVWSVCLYVSELAESMCKKTDNHRLLTREKRKGEGILQNGGGELGLGEGKRLQMRNPVGERGREHRVQEKAAASA